MENSTVIILTLETTEKYMEPCLLSEVEITLDREGFGGTAVCSIMRNYVLGWPIIKVLNVRKSLRLFGKNEN